jgi:hypothetical protein
MKPVALETEPPKLSLLQKERLEHSRMNNLKAMKTCLSLLVSLDAVLLLTPTAAAQEKMRIILDTDAMAEVDDQHALAYALFSGDHFEVEGITVNRGSDYPERTERRPYFGTVTIDDHYREAVNMARMCASSDVMVLKGPAGNYRQIKGDSNHSTFDGSGAVNFIIERAHAPSDRPLHIYAMGNLTNVALALLKDPTIAPKIEIWWIGTEWPQNYACNNHAGDLDAVDALLANPQIVANSGLNYTLVRASWFNQNFIEGAFLDFVLAGHVALPMPEAAIPFVDADDIAEVVTKVLVDDTYNGETITVTGPKKQTFEQVVKIMEKAIGRDIQYIPLSIEEFKAGMKAAGLPDSYVWLFGYLFKEVLGNPDHQAVSEDVKRVLGRSATTFEAYTQKTLATGVWNQSVSESM